MKPSPVNLADPEFEPSDEDLQTLSVEAFADIPRRNRELLARLRRDIADHRAAALAYFENLTAPHGRQ